jgi:hypothetical protein
MCGKMRFASRAEAKAWAREAKRSGSGDQRPYLCQFGECGCWHLTSRYTARDSRRIAKAKARRSP